MSMLLAAAEHGATTGDGIVALAGAIAVVGIFWAIFH